MLNTIFFLVISLILTVGVAQPILSNISAGRSFISSSQAFLTGQSAVEEAYYRLVSNMTIGSSQTITLGSSSAVIAVVSTTNGKRVFVNASSSAYQRNFEMDLALGTGVAFHYGIQSGKGGFVLQNSSSVIGNIFSSGSVVGAGNTVYGDVISSGPGGLISGIIATGSAYSHIIQNSTVQKNAYYSTLTNTTVNGTKYPNSADQPDADLPIDDAQIAEWEGYAAAGGTATCTNGSYSVSNNVTLGPIKIPCDLDVSGNGTTLTVTGPIWVVGNISMTQSSVITMSPSLGSQNVAIIADNPAASTTSGIISLGNGASFSGSGSANSFVFMISQNGSGENGGSTQAISVGQSSTALVGYAIHGLISLAQSVSLKEVTAYKITLQNSANVVYDTGLPNTLFSAGPGGGYSILNWSEI